MKKLFKNIYKFIKKLLRILLTIPLYSIMVLLIVWIAPFALLLKLVSDLIGWIEPGKNKRVKFKELWTRKKIEKK